MPDSALSPAVAWTLAALILLVALAVYGVQIRRLVSEGGKVDASRFDLPELLVSLVLAGYFTFLTISPALTHGTKQTNINIDAVLPVSLFFIILVAGIAGFLSYRRLPLRQVFGLDRVSLLPLLGWSLGLLAAAFPLLQAANALAERALRGNVENQALVDLFNSAVHHHDYRAIGTIFLSAVCIQPACEEFLFRGFFYGIWKRYVGPIRSALLASLLFAAFHNSLSAFAGLFVLAVCLNIAYERTGSLFVPILMHALFNLTELLLLFSLAQLNAPR
ncbi:MAG TPA: type II CAAX endopeptidase family protein [Chthoniobacter sp.]